MNYPKCECFKKNEHIGEVVINVGESKSYEVGRQMCLMLAMLMEEYGICSDAREFTIVTTISMMMTSHAATDARGDEVKFIQEIERFRNKLPEDLVTRAAQLELKVKRIMEHSTQ